ncbi:MAG: hypothetical protein CL840_16335 [Crocinitomicaceae bacterium]|nr:hypothetical protein [Crocinitomicaceae bacterium]|tara:strand:- start:1884 stop:2540 length:657 start_codon:yes stop_codon:yes gene_type:complete
MAIKVFISKGSATTTKQREFIDGVLHTLDVSGLSPRIMFENEWSHEQPLTAIKKVIKECSGAVIIAFERTIIKEGFELKKDGKEDLANTTLPTPWNQIEAAMAYSYGLPLLVIAENGLKSEGLIEQGYDWNVYWTELSVEAAKSESFKGFLNSWKKSVVEFHSRPSKELSDPGKLTVAQLLRVMNIPQLWSLFAAIVSLLIAVATFAYKTGAGKWPWG